MEGICGDVESAALAELGRFIPNTQRNNNEMIKTWNFFISISPTNRLLQVLTIHSRQPSDVIAAERPIQNSSGLRLEIDFH